MDRILIVDTHLEQAQALHEYLSRDYEVSYCHPKELSAHCVSFEPYLILFANKEALLSPEHLTVFTLKYKTLLIIPSASDFRMQEFLDAGVTDWIVEPLNFEQLTWKLKFLFRKDKPLSGEQFVFNFIDLKVHPQEHRIIAHNRTMVVTPIQMRLILAFHSYPNRLMSRDWLRFKVWNGEPISLRSIDAHISKLKKLLPEMEPYLESVYGKGYLWKPQEAKVQIKNS